LKIRPEKRIGFMHVDIPSHERPDKKDACCLVSICPSENDVLYSYTNSSSKLINIVTTFCCVYRVEILHLKADYMAEDMDSCDRELERFLHYVSII
jgi:hypothetical protein